MATTYDYTINYTGYYIGRGTIKYNVSTENAIVEPGDTITISGQINNVTQRPIKSIGVYFGKVASPYYREPFGLSAYKNVSIAGGTTATFKIQFSFPFEMWDQWHDNIGSGISTINIQPFFVLGIANMNDDLLYDSAWVRRTIAIPDINKNYNNVSSETYPDYVTLKTSTPGRHVNPRVGAYDAASVSALTQFGGFATDYSSPRVSIYWGLQDGDYEKRTTHVKLTVSGVISEVFETDVVGRGAQGSLIFSLPTPTQSGTVQCLVNLIDNVGTVSTISESYTVYSYSPPQISSFFAERYKETPTSSSIIHELADDGEFIWLTLTASVESVNESNAWDASITIWPSDNAEIDTIRGKGQLKTLDGTINEITSWSLSGSDGQSIRLNRDELLLSMQEVELSASYDWSMRITITDALKNSVTLVSYSIQKADAVFDVEPYGVAIGKRSTGVENGGEKFECAWPSLLFGGISTVGGGDLCTSTQLALGIQMGGGNYGSTFSSGYKDVAFTFETPYKVGTTPHIVAGLACNNITNADAGGVSAYVLVDSITNLGFSVRLINSTSRALNPGIRWIAIGQMEA